MTDSRASVREKRVEIEGLGEVTVREMSAWAYAELQDAKAAGKSKTIIGANIIKNCVAEFADDSEEDILRNNTPGVMAILVHKVMDFSGMDAEGNSEAERDEEASSESRLRSA